MIREIGMIVRDQTFSDVRIVMDGCSFYNWTPPKTSLFDGVGA
jgi:hypothetical protein